MERGRGREKTPVGRAAFSENRGNSVWQGILKGEPSGNGPRLSVECTWHHPIKPAHVANSHIQTRHGGRSAVPASLLHPTAPHKLRKAAHRPRCMRAEAEHQHSPCSSSLVFPGPELALEVQCPDWTRLPSPGGDTARGSRGRRGIGGVQRQTGSFGGDHEGVAVYVGGGAGGYWGTSSA